MDSMLGFFLVLQAISIIPLCILPTQTKLHETQRQTGLKIALYQKLQQTNLQQITLDNRQYTFDQHRNVVQVYCQNVGLTYDTQTKTFRFFTK